MRGRWEAWREYTGGALWVLPVVSIVVALVLGALLSRVHVGVHAPVHRLLFEGTVDDARTLLVGITGAVITVIALVLGLTLVALQLSVDPVLTAGAAQLLAGPAQPAVPVGDGRHLYLFGGWAVHGGRVGGAAHRFLSAACRHLCHRVAVRQPRGADLLSRSPGPFDPDRPADGRHRARHDPGHQRGATRPVPWFWAGRGARAAGVGGRDPGPQARLRADHPRRTAAPARRAARGERADRSPGRRACRAGPPDRVRLADLP